MSRLDKDHMTHIPQVPRHRSNAASATPDPASDSWLAIPDFTLVAEIGTCPTIAAKPDIVTASLAETQTVAASQPVVGIEAALDAPMLMTAASTTSDETPATSSSAWPLDASIQVHPERPGLKPVLANLGSYTGLVGHLVRMSTSDWRRTVVILGVGMLAILSWMRSGTPSKGAKKLASPLVTAVPDVSSIEQLSQEPLRASSSAKKPPALPSPKATTPPVASRSSQAKVEDADLFDVKSLEASAAPGSKVQESTSNDKSSAKPDWPAFQSPSGTKISRFQSSDDREDGREEVREERVAKRKRWGRMVGKTAATESDDDESYEDERRDEDEEVRVLAQRRSPKTAEEYPSTDADEYPPYEMPTAARRASRWAR